MKAWRITVPPFAKAQTELTSCKVGWLPFDQCCGKQPEIFKPEQIKNWREGAQCWVLFGLGFFFQLHLDLVSHTVSPQPPPPAWNPTAFLQAKLIVPQKWGKSCLSTRNPWLVISTGPSAKRPPGHQLSVQQGVKLFNRAGALALVPQLWAKLCQRLGSPPLSPVSSVATVGPVEAQSGVRERCWTWSILSQGAASWWASLLLTRYCQEQFLGCCLRG